MRRQARSSVIPCPDAPGTPVRRSTGQPGALRVAFTVLADPIPKARPRIYRGRGVTDPATTRAEQQVVMAARRAKVQPIPGPVVVWLAYFRRTKRRCDWDNLAKLTCDALNGIAWADDSQIVEAHVQVSHDKDQPRTEVRVASTSVALFPPVAGWDALVDEEPP